MFSSTVLHTSLQFDYPTVNKQVYKIHQALSDISLCIHPHFKLLLLICSTDSIRAKPCQQNASSLCYSTHLDIFLCIHISNSSHSFALLIQSESNLVCKKRQVHVTLQVLYISISWSTQQDYYDGRCGTLLHSYCTSTYTEVTVLLLWSSSSANLEYPCRYSNKVAVWVLHGNSRVTSQE